MPPATTPADGVAFIAAVTPGAGSGFLAAPPSWVFAGSSLAALSPPFLQPTLAVASPPNTNAITIERRMRSPFASVESFAYELASQPLARDGVLTIRVNRDRGNGFGLVCARAARFVTECFDTYCVGYNCRSGGESRL